MGETPFSKGESKIGRSAWRRGWSPTDRAAHVRRGSFEEWNEEEGHGRYSPRVKLRKEPGGEVNLIYRGSGAPRYSACPLLDTKPLMSGIEEGDFGLRASISRKGVLIPGR